MGSLGESIRKQVRDLIADPNIRSSFTLIPITRTEGSNSGYEENTEAEGTNRSVYAIPFNYIKSRVLKEQLGDLVGGEVRFLIRDDETIDSNDKVVYGGDTWHIREIKSIDFNEVTAAIGITLTKVQ